MSPEILTVLFKLTLPSTSNLFNIDTFEFKLTSPFIETSLLTSKVSAVNDFPIFKFPFTETSLDTNIDETFKLFVISTDELKLASPSKSNCSLIYTEPLNDASDATLILFIFIPSTTLTKPCKSIFFPSRTTNLILLKLDSIIKLLESSSGDDSCIYSRSILNRLSGLLNCSKTRSFSLNSLYKSILSLLMYNIL